MGNGDVGAVKRRKLIACVSAVCIHTNPVCGTIDRRLNDSMRHSSDVRNNLETLDYALSQCNPIKFPGKRGAFIFIPIGLAHWRR